MTETRPAGLTLFVLAVHLAVAVLAGVIVFTASAAFVTGWFVPAVVAAVVAPVVAAVTLRSRPALASAPPRFRLLFILGALAAGGVLVRLAVFMVAPAAAGWSLMPANAFMLQHSCVSAYTAQTALTFIMLAVVLRRLRQPVETVGTPAPVPSWA